MYPLIRIFDHAGVETSEEALINFVKYTPCACMIVQPYVQKYK
jgi:hypothetical protein